MTLSFYLQSEIEWVMRKIGICWNDCPSLCKVKSFLLWRQFPRSPNLSLCSFVDNLHQSDPRHHEDRHRPSLFHIQPGCRKLWNFQWVQKPSKFWSSMYWLIHDKCISFARICKIATKKKSCYQQKGKKLQKIYLCTIVEGTKIGNKKMKKCPQSV